MISIKVLGPGCGNCGRVGDIARKVVSTLSVEAEIEKVTDYPEIMKYRILATPALVINGQVKCAGRIPSEAEVTTWVMSELAVQESPRR